MSRRVNPARRALLLSLYHSGRTYKQIADEYGGTKLGVYSTIRKMRERGDTHDRRKVRAS